MPLIGNINLKIHPKGVGMTKYHPRRMEGLIVRTLGGGQELGQFLNG